MRKIKKTRTTARRVTRRLVRRSSSMRKVVKSVKKGKSVPAAKAGGKKSEGAKSFEAKAAKLIQKGRDRGFVTYDEILKEFPQIENDIVFLDDLYGRLATANVDILEGGGLLEIEDLSPKKVPSHFTRGGSSRTQAFPARGPT